MDRLVVLMTLFMSAIMAIPDEVKSRNATLTSLDHQLTDVLLPEPSHVDDGEPLHNVSAVQTECLEELFEKYGDENGDLTFTGFQKLLRSIGLGDNNTSHNTKGGQHRDEHHEDITEYDYDDDDVVVMATYIDDDHFHELYGDTHPDAHLDIHFMEQTHIQMCLSPGQLFHIYGFHPWERLDASQFLKICPILVQQLDSHMCHQEDHTHGEESVQIEQHGGFAAPLIVWGYGFLSITVISAVSLMGIMTVPLTRRYPKLYKRVLSYLVALAVGSLSGDALLHLIPHSFDSHDDGPSSHSLDPVYRGLIVLFGIYFFFMVERIMNLVNGRKKKRKNRRKFKGKFWISYQSESVGAKLNKHEERYNSLQYIQMITVHKGTGETHSYIQKPEKQDEEKCSQNHNHDDHHHSDHHHDTHQHSDHHPDGHHDRDEEAEENQGHHGHSHNHGDIKSQNIASVAWMVIMGDGLHNFSDGLAIGAAFAGSITAGLSTTIAVFCHELPHELGDFAILLSSGMRVKQAVMYSLVSSILAYIGMCIGVALGNIESMSSWLFALAGGMFLYIALVDMLPEMANAASTKDESQCCHLLLQNLGFLTGISIMLAIAMFEEDLLVALE